MSDFWNDIDEEALDAGKYDADDENQPLPEGTKVPVILERIGYFDKDNLTVNAMWRVTGGEFANRVIFHKMLIDGADAYNPGKTEGKRKRGRQQFVTMLHLAGAKDVLNDLRNDILPTEQEVQEATVGRIDATITLGLWDIDGRTGNWVKGIEGQVKQATPAKKPAAKRNADLDDEIPF